MIINVHGGHNPAGKTACGAVGLLDESREDRIVKDIVIERLRDLGHTVYDCTVDNGTSQNDVLKKIVAKCNAHDVDLDVSIHFNSGRNDYGGDGKAGGTEVWLYSQNSKAKSYAQRTVDAIANRGFTNRGLKYSTGLYFLRKANAPAMLVECCFVDDKDDQKIYNAEKMANAIVKGITGLEVGSVSGLSDVQNKDGNWYYYRNGKIDTGYTGLAKNKNGWFYVRNGKVDFSRTGLEKNQYGWFYVKIGKVDFEHTGLVKNDQGWWYVEKGTITFKYNGLVSNDQGIWYVRNSKVDFGYNGSYDVKIKSGKMI